MKVKNVFNIEWQIRIETQLWLWCCIFFLSNFWLNFIIYTPIHTQACTCVHAKARGWCLASYLHSLLSILFSEIWSFNLGFNNWLKYWPMSFIDPPGSVSPKLDYKLRPFGLAFMWIRRTWKWVLMIATTANTSFTHPSSRWPQCLFKAP